MTTLKPIYALPFILVLASALPGCATFAKSAPGEYSGDAKITANIQATLDQHPELGAPHSISVQTRAGVVYLDGEVSQGLERETAESLATETPGVERVVDSIFVSR